MSRVQYRSILPRLVGILRSQKVFRNLKQVKVPKEIEEIFTRGAGRPLTGKPKSGKVKAEQAAVPGRAADQASRKEGQPDRIYTGRPTPAQPAQLESDQITDNADRQIWASDC